MNKSNVGNQVMAVITNGLGLVVDRPAIIVEVVGKKTASLQVFTSGKADKMENVHHVLAVHSTKKESGSFYFRAVPKEKKRRVS